MKDTIRLYSLFFWALVCACLGMCCEYAGQAFIYSGHWLMCQADTLGSYTQILIELD